jgi:hypothetical protein
MEDSAWADRTAETLEVNVSRTNSWFFGARKAI